jgi:hypothetical protein
MISACRRPLAESRFAQLAVPTDNSPGSQVRRTVVEALCSFGLVRLRSACPASSSFTSALGRCSANLLASGIAMFSLQRGRAIHAHVRCCWLAEERPWCMGSGPGDYQWCGARLPVVGCAAAGLRTERALPEHCCAPGNSG